jgi:hypothetical protein
MHAEEAENAETTINAGIAEGRSVPASCDEPIRFVAPDTPGGPRVARPARGPAATRPSAFSAPLSALR